MIGILLGTVMLGQTAQTKPDLRFMQSARYMAGSIADPAAPGGYGRSNNDPRPVSIPGPSREGVQAFLTRQRDGLRLVLANGGKSEQWLNAGDSNIFGFLQAQNSRGEWQPIEYHHWYGCGNSYHRVQLPPSKGWTFTVAMPVGPLKTKLRWHYEVGNVEVNSNELETTIPAERFQIPPALREQYEIRVGGPYPKIMLKGSQRG